MFKVNKDIAKKSLKQIMVISAIATLLMASMGSIPSMKSYAQRDGMDFMKMVPGMGGSDRSDGSDKGSIGADSLLGCFGVATDCVNKDNNNRHTHIDINNGAGSGSGTGNGTGTGNTTAACDSCLTKGLTPTQLSALEVALNVKVGDIAALCAALNLQTVVRLDCHFNKPTWS